MTFVPFLPRLLSAAIIAAVMALPGFAAETLKVGKFKGSGGHATSGGVSIVEQDGKYFVHLGDDFAHDGTAPDATVGLGNSGYVLATNMGKLRKNAGKQDYQLPDGIDPSKFNEVYIWCTEFAVPLGVAKIK